MWHRHRWNFLIRQQLKFKSLEETFAFLFYTSLVRIKVFKNSPFRNNYFFCVTESDSILMIDCGDVFQNPSWPSPSPPLSNLGKLTRKCGAFAFDNGGKIKPYNPLLMPCVGTFIPAQPPNHHKTRRQLLFLTLSISFWDWLGTYFNLSRNLIMWVINIFIPFGTYVMSSVLISEPNFGWVIHLTSLRSHQFWC